MDIFLLLGIAISLFGFIVSLYFFQKKHSQEVVKDQGQQRRNQVRVQDGIPRRAQIIRNQRNRLRGPINQEALGGQNRNNDSDHDGDDDDNGPQHNDDDYTAIKSDEKIGTKKRAKLEAKAEKRAQREMELQMREEQKKKQAVLDEQRKIQEQKAEEMEKKIKENERLAREEKERKEYEDYLKMKETFNVEEEGFEKRDDEDEKSLLQEFIKHIKEHKVVILEDLAANFKLKTQEAIDRIESLRENGSITGVIDDRGKFIYISEDELKAVAKFIKQRGRVSISELAESSNNLINLNSVISA